MSRPLFDQRAAEWGAEGEKAVCAWMNKRGFRCLWQPVGKFGPDLIYWEGHRGDVLEVERRQRTQWEFMRWPKAVMPYIHVPKDRVIQDLLVLEPGMQHGFIIFKDDILKAPIMTVAPHCRAEAEEMKHIRYERVLPVSLSNYDTRTFAELNRAHIVYIMETADDPETIRRCLGYTCPYGLSPHLWQESLKIWRPQNFRHGTDDQQQTFGW